MSWRQKIQQAARQFDWQQLAEVVEEYVGHLRSTPEIEDSQQIRAILSLLRECRRYEELLRVADAALGHGLTDGYQASARPSACRSGSAGRCATHISVVD